MAVISLAGVVFSKSVRVGGDELDEAIINYMKKNYNLMVGERTAEDIKIKIGSVYPLEEELKMEVRGRDLVAGLPKTVTLTSEEVREAIEDASVFEVPRLERNLPVLATVAQVAPLLGLLGTVTGLVAAFQVIESKASALNPVNPGDLAGGIWQALLATTFGLCVAIPSHVAYNYLVSRVDGFVLDMERSATDLLNILGQRRDDNEV